MIDHNIAGQTAGPLIWFQFTVVFWRYLLPLLFGFVSICAFQLNSRVAMGGHRVSRIAVFGASFVTYTLSLAGWTMVARTLTMIPIYALGAACASAVMSRVFAVTLPKHRRFKVRIPYVIWRGDTAAIEKFRERMRVQNLIESAPSNQSEI